MPILLTSENVLLAEKSPPPCNPPAVLIDVVEFALPSNVVQFAAERKPEAEAEDVPKRKVRVLPDPWILNPTAPEVAKV